MKRGTKAAVGSDGYSLRVTVPRPSTPSGITILLLKYPWMHLKHVSLFLGIYLWSSSSVSELILFGERMKEEEKCYTGSVTACIPALTSHTETCRSWQALLTQPWPVECHLCLQLACPHLKQGWLPIWMGNCPMSKRRLGGHCAGCLSSWARPRLVPTALPPELTRSNIQGYFPSNWQGKVAVI